MDLSLERIGRTSRGSGVKSLGFGEHRDGSVALYVTERLTAGEQAGDLASQGSV